MTAIFLSSKQSSLRIAIVEKETIMNSRGSSGSFDQQQFRQMYNEEYLAELANMSFSLWRELEQMADLPLGSILNTDNGHLFVEKFNVNQSTVEGDFLSIKQTCKKRQMGCEYLNTTQLQMRYPAFSFSPQYQGIFHPQSDYINVSTLMTALLRILSRKVLFVPGPYANNISHLLNFDLNITLWELPIYYFRLLPNTTPLPKQTRFFKNGV